MTTPVCPARQGGLGPPRGSNPPRGFTLLELLIVIGLVLLLASMVVPVFTGEIARRRLADSIGQMQSLVQLTRAHAMNDGKRYRIRWPEEDAYKEAEEKSETLQPIVEVEADPIGQPGVFTEVKDLWVQGDTLHSGIQCVRVELGQQEPNDPNDPNQSDEMRQIASGVDQMFDDKSELEDMFEQDMDEAGSEEEKDPVRPAIVFETDGTAEWARIYLTNGDAGEDGEPQTWEIAIDGRTGSVGWRKSLSESEAQEMVAQAEANQEEHKIVRGREIGAQ
jgi:prepilin-type N-terminal cleavage/methylation domain-containing protein